MQLHPADYLAGEANVRKRQRAHEVRELDKRITTEMVGKWKASIELGVTRGESAKEEEEVIEGEGLAAVGEGAAALTPRVGNEGEAWGSRRALLSWLQRAAAQQQGVGAGEVRDAQGHARGVEDKVGENKSEVGKDRSRGVDPTGGTGVDAVGAADVREGHEALRQADVGERGERKRLLTWLHGEVKRQRRCGKDKDKAEEED